jgi:hypothetical protein
LKPILELSIRKELYIEIIEPLGHKAKEKNDDFIQSYSQIINKFTLAFASEYCLKNGLIDWNKLVQYNSSILLSK